MAPITPPSYMQAGSYPSRLDRLALGGLLIPHASVGPLKGRSGVKPNSSNTSLQVTQRATPDRWVTVAAGTCFIGATSATGGSYECHNDAAYDVQTSAAHATLPRKDLIVAQVRDAVDDTGSNNDFVVTVVTGTPASSPARPATPNQALALAEVLVPANSTTVVNANITDLRQQSVALGGVLPCRNASEVPASPHPGMKIYRLDLQQEQIWDATAAVWQSIGYGGWTTFSTTWTASATNPSKGNATENSGYRQIGKLTFFRIHIVAGSTTNFGNGAYGFSLPFPPAFTQAAPAWFIDTSASNRYPGSAILTNGSDVFRVCINPAGSVGLGSGSIVWGSGDEICISGVYEAA